jgi:hypothetical protein
MRFAYSNSDTNQTELDSLPRLPIQLNMNNSSVEVFGLVDSGATINVLPFSIGQKLGAIWDNKKAIIQLAGNLSNSVAQPIVLKVNVGNFKQVTLAFAWVSHDNVPVILGQTNFFNEFEVRFFRNTFEFEVKPKRN